MIIKPVRKTMPNGKDNTIKEKKQVIYQILFVILQLVTKSYISMDKKEKIRTLLEEVLPLVDLDSDFLFSELDSLGVTTILMALSKEYDIELEAADATPKNLRTLDSITALVERKIKEKNS